MECTEDSENGERIKGRKQLKTEKRREEEATIRKTKTWDVR